MQFTSSRRAAALAVSVAVLALASACSGGADGTNSIAADRDTSAEHFNPPGELSVTTPLTKAAPDGLDVVFVSAGLSQTEAILSGLEAAGEVLGWSIDSMTYDLTNPATINSTIESAIAASPDAIVLNGLLEKDVASTLPLAKEAGIPIIPAASVIPAADGIYPVLLPDVEYTYSAKILADTILADAEAADTDAHVLQLTLPSVAAIVEPFDAGVESGIKECAECSYDVLGVGIPELRSGAYTGQVVSQIQRNPDTNVVVADSHSLSEGLRAALDQAGLNKVAIYGLNPEKSQIAQLQAGDAGAWVAQPYVVKGWIVADQIARAVVGDDTDLWNEETLAYVLTASNVDGVDPAGPQFPAGYETMFKNLWGK